MKPSSQTTSDSRLSLEMKIRGGGELCDFVAWPKIEVSQFPSFLYALLD